MEAHSSHHRGSLQRTLGPAFGVSRGPGIQHCKGAAGREGTWLKHPHMPLGPVFGTLGKGGLAERKGEAFSFFAFIFLKFHSLTCSVSLVSEVELGDSWVAHKPRRSAHGAPSLAPVAPSPIPSPPSTPAPCSHPQPVSSSREPPTGGLPLRFALFCFSLPAPTMLLCFLNSTADHCLFRAAQHPPAASTSVQVARLRFSVADLYCVGYIRHPEGAFVQKGQPERPREAAFWRKVLRRCRARGSGRGLGPGGPPQHS